MAHNFLAVSLCLVTGTVAFPAEAQTPAPDFVRKYEAGVPVQSRSTDFDSRRGTPLPKNGRPAETGLVAEAEPYSAVEKQAFNAALKALVQSKQLDAKLEDSSRLLSGGALPKPRTDKSSDLPEYKFTYYNYKRDHAIEAYVAAGKVTKIVERELGYQPTVSREELIDAANIVAVQAPAFKDKVDQQSSRALAQSGPNGRREIRVFTADQRESAVVDLYSRKVVDKRTAE